VNGSLSKTAVNGSSGARTQLSGLVVAVLTVVTLLLLTGLFESLPEATLAAIVIAAVIELVDLPALARLFRVYAGRSHGLALAARADFLAALAAMLGVLIFDTLPGLFIGIGVSLLLLLYRASRPHVAELGEVHGASGQWGDLERHPENRAVPGVVVLRVDGGLFFANADGIRRRVLQAAARDGVHAVVLDAETVPYVDLTAAEMLSALHADVEREGAVLALARDIGGVRDVLRRADVSLEHVYPSVAEAVAALSRKE
jgi:sulfate permease, SulP family